MINLNDDLYKEISKAIKKDSIEYPTIKNFVEKAARKELFSFKAEKEDTKKAKHLFSLFAERKFKEIEKMFPGSQKKR